MNKTKWMPLEEIEELVCIVCGKNEDEIEDIINSDGVDDLLYQKYEISFEQYYNIVKDLIDFTPVIQTELTKSFYRGFVNNDRFIVKKQVDKT